MDHLKEGIGLRGYGQHDPLVEYKRESFDMFEAMMQRFQEETVRYLYLMQILERPPRGARRSARQLSEADPMRAATATAAVRRGTSRPRWTSSKKSFQRKKTRELEQARMAGSGEAQHGAAGRARRSKSRPQRSLSLRLRQEIQEVLRRPIILSRSSHSTKCVAPASRRLSRGHPALVVGRDAPTTAAGTAALR